MKNKAAAKGKTESKKQTIKTKQKMTTTNKTENMPAQALSQKDKYIMVSPSLLVPNPKNPRIKYEEIEELMHSIVENGLLVPLTGYYKGDKIHLKDGHRRMKAIQLAFEKGNKIERVPVIIAQTPSEEQETLDYLIYNDGKPLNMIEQSEVIKRLLNFGWKVTDIVRKTGKARGYIENLIILTKIPMKIYNYILEDKISAHAVIQLIAAIKGDETKLLAAVEEAISVAKAAGKSKATPKHVKNEKVKGQSFGKFYKWLEEIVDELTGRKDVFKEKEKVISDMLVYFENGRRPIDVLFYFIDKTKKVEIIKPALAKPVTHKKTPAKPAKKITKKK